MCSTSINTTVGYPGAVSTLFVSHMRACRLDLVAAQTALSAPDLRVVLLHLTSFLLSYCINQWPAAGLAAAEPAIHAALAAAAAPAASACAVPVATVTRTPGGSSGGGAAAAGGGRPAAGSNGGGAGPAAAAAASAAAAGLVTLLNEVLLLAGLYVLLQPANQDVLLWGRSPTILQLLAEVPFAYLVEPQLYQVRAGALGADSRGGGCCPTRCARTGAARADHPFAQQPICSPSAGYFHLLPNHVLDTCHWRSRGQIHPDCSDFASSHGSSGPSHRRL